MVTHTFPGILAVCVGFCSHWTYFIHGERDLAAAKIARTHLLAFFVLLCLKWHYEALSVGRAGLETALLSAFYASALFTSIIVYRLFLSPLRSIPGPLSMRISKLVHVWQMADPKKQNCKVLHAMQAKYGKAVRTGPNEVTLFGIDAYNKVHGPDSKCRRATYYDILHPMVSLDTTRDPAQHSYRRKLWDQAFSFKALENAEHLIYRHATELVDQLRLRTGSVVDMSAWVEYYSFDLMGALGLTIDFQNLRTDGGHPILKLWHIAHRMLAPMNAAPWIKHLMMGIPFIERIKYYRMFMTWADQELDRNIKEHKDDRTNIIGYVIKDAMEHGGIKKNWNWILGDFVLVVAAGSDPVRHVLAHLLYYLMREPRHLDAVLQELASVNIRHYKSLQYLQHFNACIYETLRLEPAVPSAGLRMPPKGGMSINGVFVPEDTTIVTPQYSTQRDETCFVEPNQWIPERFTMKPELILNKNAFVPWSTGKLSCLGKNLSLMESRVAAALLLTQLKFRFPAGQTGQSLFTEATDFFTTTPGPLEVIVEERV